MSEKEAGWYPDPAGSNQLRLWDGSEWTEYLEPNLPTAATPEGAGSEAYSYLATAGSATTRSATARSGPGGAGADASLGGAELPPGWQPGTQGRQEGTTLAFGAKKSKARLLPAAFLIGGLVIILVVVSALSHVVSSREDEGATAAPAPPSAPPGSGPTVDEPITLDDHTDADLPAGGEIQSDFRVDATSTVAFAIASGGSDVDLDAAILDSQGKHVADLEDRGRQGVEIFGGTSLDPLGFPQLEPGDYTLAVTEKNGAQSSVSISTAQIATKVRPNSPHPVSIHNSEIWLATATITNGGTYHIEAQAHSPANATLGFYVLTSDDHQLVNNTQDPQAGADNPQLNARLPRGQVIIGITNLANGDTEATLSIDGPQ